MATITTFDARLKAAYIAIHRAIHSPEVIELRDEHGGSFPVRRAANGCRFIDYEGTVFMEQNKNKPSAHAMAARNGTHITWGLKSSPERWIYIDDDIANAFEERAKTALDGLKAEA